jgi:hypothetical protein
VSVCARVRSIITALQRSHQNPRDRIVLKTELHELDISGRHSKISQLHRDLGVETAELAYKFEFACYEASL